MKNSTANKNQTALSKKIKATTSLVRPMQLAALAGAMVFGSAGAKADDHAWTNWTDTNGTFTVDTSLPSTTTINSTSSIAGGNSNNLDILGHQTVIVNQQDSGSLFYGRAADDADPTEILGTLRSNGRLLVLDRNGVFFGQNSRVDAAGIVATSGDIADSDILDGNGTFTILSADTDGAVDLQGTISVNDGGLAAFVAPTVRNSGIISAKMGKVALASGETTTLDFYGDNLVEVAVDSDLENALIENSGTISAQGGVVQMDVQTAKAAVDDVINMSGVVDVSSVEQVGGKIILSGGKKGVVKVSGKLDASGKTGGGSIKVTGQNVHVAATGSLAVDAIENGDGGSAYVYGDNVAVFEGALTGRGGEFSGNGGNSEISAGASVGFYGLVDLGASNGDVGTLLIDPQHLTISNAGFSMDLLATFTLGLLGSVNINDQALANALRNNHVNLWATETLSTGSNIDVSTWTQTCGFICQLLGGSPNGITSNNLTLAAPTVNLVHDITLGTGALNVRDLTPADSVLGFNIVNPPHTIVVDTLNLNGKIFTRSTVGGATTLASDAQINTTADVINVLSNSALIQQAVFFADTNAASETVNVGAGTYNETVQIDRNLNLVGAGQGTTVIAPTSLGAAPALSNGTPWNGQFYTPILLAKDTGTVNISGLTVNGSGVGGNKAGVTYYNAGGTVEDVTVTNGGTFGVYAVADGTKGHVARTVNVTDVISSGNSWASLAAIGNLLTINVTGGNYSGAGASSALDLSNGSQGSVTGATLSTGTHADKAGISFHGGHDFDITDVTINGGGADTVGIADDGTAYGVAAASNITVNGGTISNVGIGVDAVGGSNWTVAGVDINGVGAGKGISFKNLTGTNTIGGVDDADGNDVSGFINGVVVETSSGTTLIQNNDVTGNTDTPSGRASSDWQTGIGIFLKGVTGIVDVLANTVTGNTDGIRVQDMDPATRGDVTVSGNTASNNQDKGIILKRSDNIEVLENIVNGNAIGIYADASSNALIKANDINGSTDAGIRLRDGSNGVDIENNWIHGGPIGVHVDNSLANVSGVTIYDNSFAEADGSQSNVKNIVNGSASIVNASFNWFGSVVEAAVAGKITGAVDISPYQGQGVDQQPATAGYQGNLDDLYVTDAGAQTAGLIQEAVDLAGNNGQVKVNAGNYTENLMLDFNNMKLEGLSGATLNYDVANAGRGVAGNLITVTGDNVNIDPFVFNGGGVANYGINANGAHGLIIDGNTFLGFVESNISVINSNEVRIYGNTTTGAKKGVYVSNTPNIWVYNNDINDATVAGVHLTDTNGTDYVNDADVWYNRINSAATATGIWVERSDFATVGAHLTNQPFGDDALNGNVITGGRWGIWVSESDNAMVRHNVVKDQVAGVNHNDGITIWLGSDVTVQDNLVQRAGWDGINLYGTVRAQILNNTVEDSNKSAIVAYGADDTLIQGNVLNNNWGGTWIGGNTDTTINNNIVNGTTGNHGIYVWGNETGLKITENVIHSTNKDGIRVERTSGDTVSGEIKNNYVGYTDKVGTTTVGNNIGGDGIAALGTSNTTISGNKVTKTVDDGIEVNVSVVGLTTYLNPNNIVDNNVIRNVGDDGIRYQAQMWAAAGLAKNAIRGNTIDATGGDGIEATLTASGIGAGTEFEISGNTIGYGVNGILGGDDTTIGGDGIHAHQTSGAVIKGNKITNATDDGIEIVSSSYATIGGATLAEGNHVTRSGHDGITTEGGTELDITFNTVKDTLGASGVAVHDTTNALVQGNEITSANLLGIYGQNSHDIEILNNVIRNVGYGAASTHPYSTGIGVESANGVTITGNRLNTVTGNAISVGRAINNGNGASSNVTVSNNYIGYGLDNTAGNGDDTNIGGNGILIVDSPTNTVSSNKITNTALNGIFVDPSPFSHINYNTVSDFGLSYNGILLDQGDDSEILGNTVTGNNNPNQTGIRVNASNRVQVGAGHNGGVDRNNITNVGTGIILTGGSDITVDNNRVFNADDGIYASNVLGDLEIFDNTLDSDEGHAGGNYGIRVIGGNDVTIGGGEGAWNDGSSDGNLIDDYARGVSVDGAHVVTIDNNDITDADYGIAVNAPTGDVYILDNYINADDNRIGGVTGISLTNTAYSPGPGGIFGATALGAVGDGNTVLGFGTGIYTYNVDGVSIDSNVVTDATVGIHVLDSQTVDVDNNQIDAHNSNSRNSGNIGIWIDGGFANRVGLGEFSGNQGNTIDDFRTGIRLQDTNGVVVRANDITDANYGIDASNVSGYLDILDNFIDAFGGSTSDAPGSSSGVDTVGIRVANIDGTEVVIGSGFGTTGGADSNGNQIDDFETGIRVAGGNNVTIDNNSITDAADFGIYVDDVDAIWNPGWWFIPGYYSDGLNIVDNTIDGFYSGSEHGEGIHVEDSVNAQIGGLNDGNFISNVDRGIHVLRSNNADVDYNDISNVDGDGILVEQSDTVDVAHNEIYNVDGDGIHVTGGEAVWIWSNNIDEVDDDGIHVDSNDDARIWDNHLNVNYAGANTGSDGILVEDSEDVYIAFNEIDDTDDNAIHLWNTDDVVVYDNTITDAHTGIRLADSGTVDADIDFNKISNVEYGIYADDVAELNIEDNIIDGRTGFGKGVAGIYVNDSYNARIGGYDTSGFWWTWNSDGNTVQDFDTGIRVIDSESADVEYNDVSEFTEYGIRVSTSDYVDVLNNDVYNYGANGTGIRVFESDFADINENDIWNLGGHGIELVDSHNVDIENNDIWDVDQHGIFVDPSDYVDITGNWINNAGWDGIHVLLGNFADIWDNEIYSSGDDGIDINDNDFVDIWDNLIDGTDNGNGIEISDSFAADIWDNRIRNTDDDGIFADNIDFGDIVNNRIRNTGDDGIDVRDSFGVDIVGNRIRDTDGDGIQVRNSDYADITDNRVRRAGDDGIDVEGSDNVEILRNLVRRATNNGIEYSGGTDSLIDDNDVFNAGDNGIDVDTVGTITISRNDVSGSDDAGIEVSNTDVANILFNNLTNNDEYGLYVRGGNNSSVVLSGNTFTNNKIGARFESGTIDFRGAQNRFINGVTALQFDLVGGIPLNLVDDDGVGGFGGTIGTTYFEGQSGYFVELMNGAMFAPGFPTVLNGLNATYVTPFGTITPSLTGGVLSQLVYNFLEGKFQHFPDTLGDGLFFFGFVPSTVSAFEIDQQDITRRVAGEGFAPGDVNVTILALPNLPGQGGGAAPQPGNTTLASLLNNIETAAGGEDDGSVYTASLSAEALNQIEAAAGENEQSNCWADATSAAQGGQAVSFSFSSSVMSSENLNSAVSCGGQQ